MIDPQYLRAAYDEKRGAYISADADWIDGDASPQYHFTLLENDDNVISWQGGLEKLWFDEEGNQYGEVIVFAEYHDEAAFDADVAQIRQEARQRSVRDNIDEFLAVTDIVKQRAVMLGYEDEPFEELEGLFQDGPEDAYTLRDWDDSPRLHDHVERADECWYLHVAAVVDPDKQPLGWGVFAVHLPDLTSDASIDAVRSASRARVLLLDHHKAKRDAQLATRSFASFMDGERLDNTEYAYMDDTEVLEGFAVETEWNDETNAVPWQEYNDQALQGFLSRAAPYVYPREKWKPRDKPIVDQFFEEFPQPIWLEDQLRAELDNQAGVEPDEDDGSPWQSLDLD
jgi:hypothetical protein